MPCIALTKEQQVILGLEGYSPQTMIAKLELPVYKPVKTKVVNYFAIYPHPEKMSLAVEVILPSNTPHQNKNWRQELLSTMSKSEMPSIALTSEQLTRGQRILLGFNGYPPQTMIAKLVLPVNEPVKKHFKSGNYFTYHFKNKKSFFLRSFLNQTWICYL